MNRMARKALAVVAAIAAASFLAMIFVLVSGCGHKDTAQSGSSDATATTREITSPTDANARTIDPLAVVWNGSGRPALDPGFTPYRTGMVSKVIPAAGGKLLLCLGMPGANASELVLLGPDGRPDGSFKPPKIYGPLYDVAMQSDGCIILAGGELEGIGGIRRRYVARLGADGTPDESFKPAFSLNVTELVFDQSKGEYVRETGDGYVTALAVQPDGKLVLCGEFDSLDGKPRNCVMRLNPDGSVDASFGGADALPKKEIDKYGLINFTRVAKVLIAPDGRIIVAGIFSAAADGQNANSLIVRLNRDGSRDPSFDCGEGANGPIRFAATKAVAWPVIRAVCIAADGRLIIAGRFARYGNVPANNIARLNADGSLDESFTGQEAMRGEVTDMAPGQDGRFTVVCIIENGNHYDEKQGVIRLNADGTLESSFVLQPPAFTGLVRAVIAQADGSVLLAGGDMYLDGKPAGCVIRLLP